MTPSRSRMMSFMDEILRRQTRQVRNPVHGPVQLVQQRQTVGLEGGIVGVDHHIVEEGVDRGFEGSERLQRGCVIAHSKGLVCIASNGCNFGHQVFFSVLDAAYRIGLVAHFALGFLQDVTDTLVGGGERWGFRQICKGPYRSESLGNITQALRFEGDNNIDFLCRVTLLTQQTRKTNEQEKNDKNRDILVEPTHGGRKHQEIIYFRWQITLN